MTKEGKYIYSIIQTSRFAPCNYSAIKKENKDRRFGSIGIDNREVNLIHHKDISAVVSPSSILNFDRFSGEKLTKYVAIHQRVNEILMKDYDLVPMAFGTIAQNQSEVLRILEKAYLQFKTALQKIAGKTEFAVQIFWDEKKLLEELVNNNPEVKKLRKEAQSPIKGIAAKLKLGKLIFEIRENKRKEYLKNVGDFLKECSLDSWPGKLLDEAMIGNISFLIEKKTEPEFDRKMQELGQNYETNLKFKYIGPMPPYSFVNINLSLGNFEIVNEARKLLGLGEEASFDEIQKTYHRLAHQYHPDKHQAPLEVNGSKKNYRENRPLTGQVDTDLEKFQEQIKKINQAYSILKSYCQSPTELTGKDFDPNQKYSFNESDIKKSIMIT